MSPSDRAGCEVTIRPVGPGDLDDVSRLHMLAFHDSVLARLGQEAVRRNYAWQLDGPHDLTAVVAHRSGRAVGYLFGGVFRGSTIGFLKREKWFLLRRVLAKPQLVLHGVGRNRLALAARLLARRTTTPQSEDPVRVPDRSFGVLAIAVAPEAQGDGVGELLMAEATARAVTEGFERMHLSVHPENARAIAFYRKLGWAELPDPDGRWAGRMTLALGEQE